MVWFNKRDKNIRKILKEERDNYIEDVKNRYSNEIAIGISTIVSDFKNAEVDSEYRIPKHMNINQKDKEIILHSIREGLQKDYDFPYPKYIGFEFIYYNFGNQGMCDTIKIKKLY